MANLQGRKVRANSGVFALGFSDKMKSVAAAAAVLALATTGTVVVQAQTAPSAFAKEEGGQGPGAEETQVEDKIIDADAIASGRVQRAANLTDSGRVGRGLISGHVFAANATGNPGATIDNGNKALNGVTVYAQFRDKDGSYSPVFKAKTHELPGVVGGNGGPGTYAFGVGDEGIKWTDARGKEHVYSARTDQYHRVWVEPFTSENGNQMQMFRQANGFVPGSFNPPSRYPLGSFVSADLNMQLTAVFLQEVAPNHETSYMAAKGDKLIHDPEGPIGNAAGQLGTSNVLSGRVWLETGGADGGIVATGPSKNGRDLAADGYTVYASTLSPEGAAANEALHKQYGDDPEQLAIETKKMLQDHPEYILKTVYGETDPEGYYALRFGDYTDRSQNRNDFLNPDHVFVWVENKEGVVQQGYTGFLRPIFQRFNAGGGFRPAAIPAENQTVTSRVQDIGNPRYGKSVNSLYNVNYALMPYEAPTITTDYNTTDNPAKPGDTVTPSFEGQLSTLPSKLEWRDKDGKVQKTCELDQSEGIKAQVSACTFDIPKDAKDGDVYTAVLVSGGNDVSASSVLVFKMEDKDLYEPEYKNGKGAPGDTAEIEAPTFTDNFNKDVDAPEGTKFEKGEGAPEGTEVDENTGAITYPIPEGADVGDEITIPVKVTYPDETSETVEVTVVVTDPDATDADKYEPEYETPEGEPGSEVTIPAPEFKDEAGNPTEVEVPEDKEPPTFEKGDGAPEGAEVNRETGEVTLEVPEDAEVGTTIEVPVVVTYPDGTTDETTAEVTVKDPAYSPYYADAPTLTAGATEPVDVTYPGSTPGEGVASYKLQEGYEVPEDWTVDVDEKTGRVTATAPDKIDQDVLESGNFNVPVTVEFSNKAASRDAIASFPFELQKDAFEPEYKHTTAQKGKPTTVDAPKDRGGKELPEGTTFAEGDDVPDWVEVNEDGSITLEPGDDVDTRSYTIPVVVTYPDGSSETVNATVTVVDELPQAEQYKPAYDDTEVKAGETVPTNNPFGEETDVPVKDVTVSDVDEWKIEKDDANNGVLDVTAPTDERLIKLYEEKFPNAGQEEGSNNPTWDEFVEAFKDIAEPRANVTITYEDDSEGKAEAPLILIGKDGNPATDQDGDFDGNGTTNREDVENGKNPFGESETPPEEGEMNITQTPTWENATTKPGVPVDVENDGDPIPEGSTVEAESDKGWSVETDETGKVTVTPPTDGKHGDKSEITVTVTYPDRSPDVETFTVTVEEDPKWSTDEDFKTTPDEPITIPNEGGPVKEGTTPEVESGNGEVSIDDNGNITVTPGDDAEPGDEIVVVVKDPETGDVIDRIVVEIVEDPEDVTQTTPNEEPQDGTLADSITPNWENKTVAPKSFVEVPNTKDELPEGTKLEFETSEEGWKVERVEGTDTLKVTPPVTAKHGAKTTVTVTVTYPDDSVDVEKFTVTVVERKGGAGTDGSGDVPGSSNLPEGSGGGSSLSSSDKDKKKAAALGSSAAGLGLLFGLGSHLSSSHGSSAPTQPGGPRGAGDQAGSDQQGAGSEAAGQDASGAQSDAADQSGADSTSASADRGGSLAMTGVSGVAIMLGAAAMAMAVGGALLALRRRRN